MPPRPRASSQPTQRERNGGSGSNLFAVDASHAARQAGLRYLDDRVPGFGRRRSGESFRYFTSRGKPVISRVHRRRIDGLAIPPAWTSVWICPSPDGHLQATGRDARGRKQYRYHPAWRTTRDQAKFEHMHAFARVLPRIRRRVALDLRGRPTERNTVCAAMVRLLDTTLVRVGNEEYARQNNSFGLSTLRHRHVSAGRARIVLHFRGKGGRKHEIEAHDPRVAAVIRRLQDLPGQEIFQYVDDRGRLVNLGSGDINDYLREISGADITAKDFRTWAATLEMARLLGLAARDGHRPTKRRVARAIASVAERLGNTPTICRKCYVHPALADAYLAGAALDFAGSSARATQRALLRFLKTANSPHHHRNAPTSRSGG